jgi:hypothetical protein
LSFSDSGKNTLVTEAVQAPQLAAEAVNVIKVSGMICLKGACFKLGGVVANAFNPSTSKTEVKQPGLQE